MFDRINLEKRKHTDDNKIRTDSNGKIWLRTRTDLEEELHEKTKEEKEMEGAIKQSHHEAIYGREKKLEVELAPQNKPKLKRIII